MIAGHLGWVRCVAMDASNEWFVTGSADRTIKVASLLFLSRADLGPGLWKSEADAHRAFAHGAWRGGVEPLALFVLLRRRQSGQMLGPGVQSRRPAQRDQTQVVTGSADATVRTWDLVTGTATSILTHHKKGVRSCLFHPV